MPLQTYFRFFHMFLCSSAPGMSRTSAHSCWEHSKWPDFPTSPFQGGGQLSHGAQKPRHVDEAGLALVDTRPLVSVTVARDRVQELRQQRGTSA